MPEIVNPYVRWGVSQGWTEGSHAKNPAIDYPMPVGTVLLAPAAGRVRLRNWGGSRSGGDPGNKVAIDLDDGRSIHIAHLSAFHVEHGQEIGQLQNLGLSGNTGDVRPAPTRANPNAGGHVHTFGLEANGARWNWTLDATPAGLSANPFEEDEMTLTTDQAKQLERVAAFVDRFIDETDPWEGEQGVDLSTPRIRQAMDASIHTGFRFVYRDASGTPTYDLAQLAQNELKPMLLTLLATAGRAPVADALTMLDEASVKAVADACADELARRLRE